MKPLFFYLIVLMLTILTQPLHAEERAPSIRDTEGQFCEECERKKHSEVDRLKKNADDIEGRAMAQLDKDPEVLKRRIEKARERMIKRIKARACPKPDEDDEEFSIDDFTSDDERGVDKSSGRGRKFPSDRDSKDSLDLFASNSSSNALDLIARDPEAMDDIEDAIEDKKISCQKKASKKIKQPQNFSNYSQAVVGSNNMMGSQNNMMAQTMAMMGNSNMMGSSMGNMGMMNSMQSYNPYSSMNSMNNMNSMNSYSPYSSLGSNYNPYSTGLQSAYGSSSLTNLYGLNNGINNLNPYSQISNPYLLTPAQQIQYRRIGQ